MTSRRKRSSSEISSSFTSGSSWPSSTQKQANQVPAVRLMVTSRMEPANRRYSTMGTRPILGRITTLPSTFTVAGPLSARKPPSVGESGLYSTPERRRVLYET